MQACAAINQMPYFEDDLVPNKRWIGKARYIMNEGKEKSLSVYKTLLVSDFKVVHYTLIWFLKSAET